MVVLIGHLTGANQKAAHCLIYQDDINDLLDKSLNALDEDEQEEYLNTYGTTMEDGIYDIQIHSGNPKTTVDGVHTESKALVIYARKFNAKLSSYLMEYIAPTSSDSLKSDIKFILSNMPYDKSLLSAAAKYADLLWEQNLYLEKYDDFKIGGVHKAALDFKLDDGSTLCSTILNKSNIVDIHFTVFTNQNGIWTIETTKTGMAKAIQWMDKNYFEIYYSFPVD
eukprot:6270561-Ditylum_brightwellii.AAC.1